MTMWPMTQRQWHDLAASVQKSTETPTPATAAACINADLAVPMSIEEEEAAQFSPEWSGRLF